MICRPALLALLLVLLAQTALAPALCLWRKSAHAGGLVTELCTMDGMRRVVIGPDGQVLPDPPAHGEFCPVCHSLPAVLLPEPPALPRPAWVLAGPQHVLPAATTLRPPIRGPPLGAQAPPALV
ncbi:DUF2946 family protein [Roseomonas frigidaquae]|uniref:DUF2946 family protein n=1 Tax=Falsiroseomonas frigidaquae TaxID=487318 RepID=A0ABX1EZJ9_9PROT|nr:DUF2946 family protein [Falsiroseomonas frigidaquae]NKE45478.1 DUF2946 family protein [Falsiroseomonas frigidaquae]